MTEEVSTVIIGAGQAGLAAGYHLARRRHPFVILDGHERVGDVWRERYDSLRLFSPARSDALPGRKFPAPPASYPTGAQMADYLEDYAATMGLPVRSGVVAHRITSRRGGGYAVETSAGRFEADEVVVATGSHREPYVPELAATHRTFLSGRIPGEVPFRIGRPSGYLADLVIPLVFLHVLTVRTPLGRKVAPQIRRHGAPLIRVKSADLAAAGVEHLPARTEGAVDGRPALADGRVLAVRNVVWCTGYREDFSWVEPAPLDADGLPLQRRGVVDGAPGLYFVGLPFQYAFASMLILGVDRDAEYVARRIAGRVGAGRVPAAVSR